MFLLPDKDDFFQRTIRMEWIFPEMKNGWVQGGDKMDERLSMKRVEIWVCKFRNMRLIK